jgi:alkanesulfonate monooxygenase SsuD/methylene tetrahydromethanopterin reductase-like flavin-dependent oxidoreductase (luciferase family)
MKEIWTRTKAEYHGEMVDFPEMMAWPKPVQKPHPPILVGGAFPHAARRAARYGDGWAPIAGRGPDGDVNELLPRFHQMLSEAGRDPQSVPVTLFGATEDADQLARYRDKGIVRVVVMLPSGKSDAILPTLDRWAELIRRVG